MSAFFRRLSLILVISFMGLAYSAAPAVPTPPTVTPKETLTPEARSIPTALFTPTKVSIPEGVFQPFPEVKLFNSSSSDFTVDPLQVVSVGTGPGKWPDTVFMDANSIYLWIQCEGDKLPIQESLVLPPPPPGHLVNIPLVQHICKKGQLLVISGESVLTGTHWDGGLNTLDKVKFNLKGFEFLATNFTILSEPHIITIYVGN